MHEIQRNRQKNINRHKCSDDPFGKTNSKRSNRQTDSYLVQFLVVQQEEYPTNIEQEEISVKVVQVAHSHPVFTKGGAELSAYNLFTDLKLNLKFESWFFGIAVNYDHLPINDSFRKIDENRVLGVMDYKHIEQSFFFVLTRVS